MVSQLSTHRIRVAFQVVDLGHAHLDVVLGLSEPLLVSLLTLEDSVDLCFDLLRSFDELGEELVSRPLLQLYFVFIHPELFFDLGVPIVALLHVLVRSAQPLLVLVHAESQTFFQLLLLGENRRVIDLFDSVPFLAELVLDLHDHVITVPLAAMLHVLDQRVADLAHFYARQNLRHLRFIDPVSALLEIFQRLR
mmetsp:Transcript_2197/g.3025  ORF Transcript_2197/g.3025 Transcript_2197/m.3025 type:complete len:194 (-) Transcript_2197:115-696(-)